MTSLPAQKRNVIYARVIWPVETLCPHTVRAIFGKVLACKGKIPPVFGSPLEVI